MEKSWRSAEAESHAAKAEAIEFVIDALDAVEELIPTHEKIVTLRAARQMLMFECDAHKQQAERKGNHLKVVGE